ncbi:MAG: hypothetical protein IKI50_01775 [Clostridia bacterium]|nr:hypothetical protein [Clostridia bacterium]
MTEFLTSLPMQALGCLLTVCVGLAECIGGWMLLKIQIVIGGWLAGAVLGYAAGWRLLHLPLQWPGVLLTLLLAAVCGVLLAAVSVKIYRFGVGCLGFLIGFGVAALLGAGLLPALAIGLGLGVLVAVLLRPAVILCTAFGGAAAAVSALFSLLSFRNPGIQLLCIFLLGLAGVAVQEKTTRRP